MLVADNGIGDRPVYSPDGSKLAFVSMRSGYGEIYILSLDSGSLSQLTYDDVTPQLDGWSRDGWIYFSSPVYNIQGERDILRVRSTGGTPLPIVAQPYINEFFGAPSPDGTSVSPMVKISPKATRRCTWAKSSASPPQAGSSLRRRSR
jgi:Tol biopolymer transport system component